MRPLALQRVFHLGDGRWWDAEILGWRDGQERRLRQQLRDEDLPARVRVTEWCTAAHCDHDTANHPIWRNCMVARSCWNHEAIPG